MTSAAALETLLQGGNAFDAGVTALLVGGVVEQDLYGLGGESLILVYLQAEQKVTSINGQGWAPKGASLDWYRTRNKTLEGAGLDPAVVPGALHGALTVLELWGTMSFAQGIAAARDRFYAGDIAEEMVAFLQAHGAPFDLSDFAEYSAKIEEPTQTTYRGYTVYKQGFGSQGPVLLQTLNILEQFDLQAMGHNSPDYVHTVVEAMKLAYADRDTYYADPDFVDVPATGLLSKAYAAARAEEIDPAHASIGFIAGDPLPYDPDVHEWPYWVANIEDGRGSEETPGSFVPSSGGLKDTSHIAIIDEAGNVFDSTPSGGWIRGAVMLGDTGIGLSTRGEQFWLDPDRANQLRPRARPRYTLTPSIVLRDGEPFLAIGTPGGDNQDQTILQTFLNIVEFRDAWYPNVHDAIQWPRVRTQHLYGY